MKILLTILGLFHFSSLIAQDFELIPYRKKQLWGFADSLRNIVIQPKYEDVIPFNHGYSAYRSNGKWGIINTKGIELTKPIFDSTGRYFGAYMEMNRNDEMTSFVALYIYKDGDRYLVDSTGTRQLRNTIMTPPLNQEKDPYAQFYSILHKNGKVGIHFLKHDKIIKPQYDSIVFIKSHIYGHNDYIFAKKNSLWAKVSMTNEPITDFEFQALQLSREEFTQVLFKRENKWGVLDKVDEVILENTYDSIITKYNRYMVLNDGNWGVLDYKFEIVVPLKYRSIEYSSDGYYVTNEENKMGFIGKEGELIIPMNYTFLEQCRGWKNRTLFKYSKNQKSELIGCLSTQSELFIPEKYVDILPCENGYFLVTTKKNGLGYINWNNEKFFKN